MDCVPRHKTISDEDILAAALEVLAAKGAGFTLNDLAVRVGLSRASLIQRFGDRRAILLQIASYEVEVTRRWLSSLPLDSGGGGLWQFLETIVGSMGVGDEFPARVAMAALEAHDPTLRDLARQRYALVQDAVAARLPDQPGRRDIADHLHGVIAGASMQWVTSDQSIALSEFVLTRLRWAIDHLPPHFTQPTKFHK
jgi:TetR/AcrR family macrolide resistance operon transcriptional repressor